MKRLLPCLVVMGLAASVGGCGTTTDGVETVTDAVSGVLGSSTPSNSASSTFVSDRFESIRFEAARGEGENVETLGALLGESDGKSFARWMKANYTPLFVGLKEPQDLVGRIRERRSVSL